ncbi:beta-lactamase class A [Actinoalloteichus hoggarensis]|uniref:Beta-lactamase regulatory protein BlaB n=1 Tax=Actinoalloteichus hoggarensis TaxID=1470176 RepID=A0A221VY31_9PSEU|nr:serine hydrolase [Actinoalloteichus hoggarensis]ASO18462.1 Beta-lactamase regulatory protein BlaB [Actinoalloteichus hoggarensis]MBB5921829.1 beta-lactamase class A [Actinoalloteichus hoggarensis]
MTDALNEHLQSELAVGGLRGGFLARDLTSGLQIGFNENAVFASASLAKIPLAVAILDRIDAGVLDRAATVTIAPTPTGYTGPPGLSSFRHPATLAVEDLVYLSVALSDNTATDALFDLVPPADVTAHMREIGILGIQVRHRTRDLQQTPAEQLTGHIDLAHGLAVHSGTPGGGHAIPQLDTSHANTGTAAGFTDLLQALWTPSLIPLRSSQHVRALMAGNVHRHRLTPDFVSDSSTWSSKTGTLLNLRHEIGVIEHADGQTIAITALTQSRITAAQQPAADILIARTARALHDHLRQNGPVAASD